MKTGSIYQKDKTIIITEFYNMWKEKLPELKWEIDNSTIVPEDSIVPLSVDN